MQDQVTALQERIAYQDRTIAALDEVVRDFTLRVERLERQMLALQNKVDDPLPDVGPHDDPPPHYS